MKSCATLVVTSYGLEVYIASRYGIGEFPVLYNDFSIGFDYPERYSKAAMKDAHRLLIMLRENGTHQRNNPHKYPDSIPFKWPYPTVAELVSRYSLELKP